MITASNVIFDEGKIVGNASFEDVLKAVLPEEVNSDEEEEEIQTGAQNGGSMETQVVMSGKRATGISEVSLLEKPVEVSSEIENLQEQSRGDNTSENQASGPEAKRKPDQGSEDGLCRSSRIRVNAGLSDTSSGLMTDALPVMVETLQDYREPECYSEAASDPRWQEAMRSEYSLLKAHGTFKHVKSYDRKPISCKWVFKIKANADESTRYKARLVARGFEQVPGLDSGETFVPVARLTIFRIYIALALELYPTIYHLDVVTAFLNPTIDENTAIAIPEGIEWLDKDLSRDLKPASALQLNKALYGLKQTPRLWYKDIAAVLYELGFKASGADPNLYLSHTRAMMILLYVDDILLCAQNDNQHQISYVVEALLARYQITNLGLVKRYLGIAVNQAADSIQLGQSHFVANLLVRLGYKTAMDILHLWSLDPVLTRILLTSQSRNKKLTSP